MRAPRAQTHISSLTRLCHDLDELLISYFPFIALRREKENEEEERAGDLGERAWDESGVVMMET